MKTKLCLLLTTAALLLTNCGEKGANVDLYKDSNSAAIDGLKFNFLVPTCMISGNTTTILSTFSVENTSSKSFELVFTTMPYFLYESDKTTYKATGPFSTVPASYVIESGKSEKFSFTTEIHQAVIVIGGFLDGYCFSFTYNDIYTINYHLYDKAN